MSEEVFLSPEEVEKARFFYSLSGGKTPGPKGPEIGTRVKAYGKAKGEQRSKEKSIGTITKFDFYAGTVDIAFDQVKIRRSYRPVTQLALDVGKYEVFLIEEDRTDL